MSDALRTGYRMIDTAQAYHNEEGVGNAVKKSGIPRKDIFLVSKVWISNYGYERAKASIDESLRKLQTDYIDLMLLHQPFCDPLRCLPRLAGCLQGGQAESHRRIELLPRPLHRHRRQHGDCSGCESGGDARVQPTSRAAAHHGGVRHAHHVVGTVCRRTQQPLYQRDACTYRSCNTARAWRRWHLRWLIQRGVIIIPKSTHVERMQQNLDIFDFELTDEEMRQIAKLDTGHSLFFNHHDAETARMFMNWK